MDRITRALSEAAVPFALVGGQAVALWVATRDPAAVRTTNDVDLLVDRDDLPRTWAAARSVGMEYFEVQRVGMLFDVDDPNPRRAVRLVWAGEKVRPDYPRPSPRVQESRRLGPSRPVVTVTSLVVMKLMANRDQDRVHLRDMIDVGLVTREMLGSLPAELAPRLDVLLTECGQ